MIGESNGVISHINSERIYRESQAQSERGQAEKAAEHKERSLTDRTSFSPEALALSRNARPAVEVVDQGQVEQQGSGQGQEQKSIARSLDIRV